MSDLILILKYLLRYKNAKKKQSHSMYFSPCIFGYQIPHIVEECTLWTLYYSDSIVRKLLTNNGMLVSSGFQRLWYVLSCLRESAYKGSLVAYQKE